ncbi:hypothetical protein VTL71DRAFT_9825 [Oculimacula yallundae]|uniref:Uncharacterized protein n=1 Tax=Oculimacula yallundae TaxID=86028 RepID=A0ABR4BQN3_9HELO
MHIHILPLLLTFLPLSLAILVPSNLPDGHWISSLQDDGTVLTTSLSDPSLPPIITSNSPTSLSLPQRLSRSAKTASHLTKRRVDCWGTNLDHAGVDRAADALTNWAAGGTELCSPTASGRNNWHGYTYRGVLVYYCIDQPTGCGNLNNADGSYRSAVAFWRRNCNHGLGFFFALLFLILVPDFETETETLCS